jgi:hypothetical protein
MRALEFRTGHVIFKLCYNHMYQLKTILLKLEYIYSIMKMAAVVVAIMTMTANIPIRIPTQIQIVIKKIKFKWLLYIIALQN